MEKILVVDDNELICDMLYDVLNEWGFCVKKAYQGIEVLPLVEEFQPNLILLDVMLPGMNGFEICKRIKSDPDKENIAIIMLTVLSDVDDRTQAVNVGADLFLSKPVNYKELRKQIDSVLGNQKKLADMEKTQNVCKFVLNLISYMDPELYKHTKEVKEYCEKLSHRMNLPEEEIAKISTGVVFGDLGRLIRSKGGVKEDVKHIIAPLKLSEFIWPYLDWDKEKYLEVYSNKENMNMKIVALAEKYFELKKEYGDSEEALDILKDRRYPFEPKLLDGLGQIISEESFVNDLNLDEILNF